MMRYLLFLMSAAVVCGCGDGSDPEPGGDGDGDSALTGGSTAAGGTSSGGSSASGGSAVGTGGEASTKPISCTPDISARMVPCEGTPAEVPTQTKSFSVEGPFAAGERVAVSIRASSRSGMTVQAFTEQVACDDSTNLFAEVQIPNADYSCAEVTLEDSAQAVRFEFLDEAVAYPVLYSVCGKCP